MIEQLSLGFSNAFLLRGDKTIIVDTGRPGNETRILQALEQRNISPADVSLILLTHGHFDHFGSARALKQKLNVPVAIHHLDHVALQNGKDPALHPTRFTGKLLKLFLHGKTESFEPDIIIRSEFNLEDYGVSGRVIHTPGHTPGSLSIMLANHDVIIGDLLMGGHLGEFFLLTYQISITLQKILNKSTIVSTKS